MSRGSFRVEGGLCAVMCWGVVDLVEATCIQREYLCYLVC
jgi:hypothetical protein